MGACLWAHRTQRPIRTVWPDGYFSGHFWQMWLFLVAVFYKKFFGYILVWWLFCGYFSIFLKMKNFNGYLAILWLFLVFK
jgi:hypothetical protein